MRAQHMQLDAVLDLSKRLYFVHAKHAIDAFDLSKVFLGLVAANLYYAASCL